MLRDPASMDNMRVSALATIRARLFAVVVLISACSSGSTRQPPMEHPVDLVGRWVRLREDSTWGDTLEYLADGRVLGSTGHPVPTNAGWGVRADPLNSREFCAADEREGSCQTYRFQDSIMVLDGGPAGPSYFRRVH